MITKISRLHQGMLAQKVAEPAKQASSIKPGALAPGTHPIQGSARDSGRKPQRELAPVSRASDHNAAGPGADAPGFMLNACFAGSATFCAKVYGEVMSG